MALAKNIEDVKELHKWKKIEDTGVKLELKRFVDGREVVSKTELIKLLKTSAKTVQRYISKNMPVHEKSIRAFQFFDIKEVMAWRDKSVDKVMSSKTAKPTDMDVEEDTELDEDGNPVKLNDMLRKLKADADKAELGVKLDTLKLAEAEGRVVDASDLDRAMSELAIVHKTDKIHDENLLPILLENKDAGEIKKLLQEHNFERLDMLDKIVNKEFKSVETMYDVVEAVLQQLKDGIEPESLVKRLKGSLV